MPVPSGFMTSSTKAGSVRASSWRENCGSPSLSSTPCDWSWRVLENTMRPSGR